MEKMSAFKINVLDMNSDSKEFEMEVDNAFFAEMESRDVEKGEVKVSLRVSRLADHSFEFLFHLEGTVQVPCDRCLDDMPCPIDTEGRLIVKLGTAYSEEDDVVTIQKEEGILDVASFVYQFILLDIPIQHVHAPGKCNAEMMEVLSRHLATRSDDGDEQEEEAGEDGQTDGPIDPRWSELLKIKNNN